MAAFSSHWYLYTGVIVFCFWVHLSEWEFSYLKFASSLILLFLVLLSSFGYLWYSFETLDFYIPFLNLWLTPSSVCSGSSVGLKYSLCNQHPLWKSSCVHNAILLSFSILPPLLKLTVLIIYVWCFIIYVWIGSKYFQKPTCLSLCKTRWYTYTRTHTRMINHCP